VSTTTDIDESSVSGYVGLVGGEAVFGANVSRHLIAGLGDIGRWAHGRLQEDPGASRRDGGSGDEVVEVQQAGADAVIGVDYESIQLGQGGSMLMVSTSGTIVKL
jgi:uncharacterized protein YbjQ (UPF0145 family)